MESLKNSIARAFCEVFDLRSAWYPEYEVLGTAICNNESEKEIDRARRELGIEVEEIHGIKYWKWGSANSPEDMWV